MDKITERLLTDDEIRGIKNPLGRIFHRGKNRVAAIREGDIPEAIRQAGEEAVEKYKLEHNIKDTD